MTEKLRRVPVFPLNVLCFRKRGVVESDAPATKCISGEIRAGTRRRTSVSPMKSWLFSGRAKVCASGSAARATVSSASGLCLFSTGSRAILGSAPRPDFYPGVQFSRQMVPSTGPYDAQVNTQAVAALFSKIGPGISVTRSPARDQVSGGNRHFLMSDLNKVRIADHLSKFLSGKTVSAIQRVRNIASEFRRFLSAAAARA